MTSLRLLFMRALSFRPCVCFCFTAVLKYLLALFSTLGMGVSNFSVSGIVSSSVSESRVSSISEVHIVSGELRISFPLEVVLECPDLLSDLLYPLDWGRFLQSSNRLSLSFITQFVEVPLLGDGANDSS